MEGGDFLSDSSLSLQYAVCLPREVVESPSLEVEVVFGDMV